ncbi:MAG: AzlD domain-containing protein [Chloroflexi bacterium]|nr:AzlD domain-containing protein [Chloroflexota bacterium]
MDQQTIFLTILGMLLVTYVPRLMPLWVLTSRSLPNVVIAWLRYVPVAVLAAMLWPVLVIQNDHVDLSLNNIFLWAAIPTLLIAWKTRSLFGSVIVGMGVVAISRLVMGV